MVGKFGLITGAGSGVGRACAEALAQDGFTLALTGRRSGPLEQTRDALAGDRKSVV